MAAARPAGAGGMQAGRQAGRCTERQWGWHQMRHINKIHLKKKNIQPSDCCSHVPLTQHTHTHFSGQSDIDHHVEIFYTDGTTGHNQTTPRPQQARSDTRNRLDGTRATPVVRDSG